MKCDTTNCDAEAFVKYKDKYGREKHGCLKCYEELNAFGCAKDMEWMK